MNILFILYLGAPLTNEISKDIFELANSNKFFFKRQDMNVRNNPSEQSLKGLCILLSISSFGHSTASNIQIKHILDLEMKTDLISLYQISAI